MYDTIISGSEGISAAARLIKEGEVVAFPTETVYGLGADGTNSEAVEKIFVAKGRPSDNPLILHFAHFSEVEKYAFVTDTAKLLFERFSPGPITIILKKKPIVPDTVTAKLSTVGIRIPSHPMARAFISACGVPIAAPSANRSTYVSPTTAQHVFDDLNGKIPMILDGGASAVGIESTILDITGDTPTILRPGGITAEMLLDVLPMVKNFTGVVKIALAPGMKYKHYAPNAECVLTDSVEHAQREFDRVKDSKRAVVMGSESFVKQIKGNTYSLGNTIELIARNVYAALRETDGRYDYIILERLSGGGLEASVMNRLFKTAANRVI